MAFHVSKHAVERYLQRVENLPFSERQFYVNRVRARSQIKDDLRGLKIESHKEPHAVFLPNYVVVVRNRAVLTVMVPGMELRVPARTVTHTPGAGVAP